MYISGMSSTPATLKTAALFYEPAGYCADDSVGWLMKRALLSIAQAADRRLEPKGITHAQWAALFMLQSRRASTVAELARETQSDPGAMTRLLDRLEAKGFCRRQRCTDDRRVVKVELTAEGEVAAQEVPGVLSQVLNEHLAGFSKTEWSQLKDMLKRMVDNGGAAATGSES
jgi:DNA-binding MarR family transcriptional regulator